MVAGFFRVLFKISFGLAVFLVLWAMADASF